MGRRVPRSRAGRSRSALRAGRSRSGRRGREPGAFSTAWSPSGRSVPGARRPSSPRGRWPGASRRTCASWCAGAGDRLASAGRRDRRGPRSGRRRAVMARCPLALAAHPARSSRGSAASDGGHRPAAAGCQRVSRRARPAMHQSSAGRRRVEACVIRRSPNRLRRAWFPVAASPEVRTVASVAAAHPISADLAATPRASCPTTSLPLHSPTVTRGRSTLAQRGGRRALSGPQAQ